MPSAGKVVVSVGLSKLPSRNFVLGCRVKTAALTFDLEEQNRLFGMKSELIEESPENYEF